MRVLVTGGLGFVGSHVVEQLLHGGHEVVVVDSVEPDAHRVTPEIDPRVVFRRHSVCDLEAMLEAVRGCDAVCHQAAKVGLGVDFTDVDAYVHHNDLGTAILLRALHEQDFRGRYVFASSMVVYGEGAYVCEHHGSVRPGPRAPDALAAGEYEPPCPHCGRPAEARHDRGGRAALAPERLRRDEGPPGAPRRGVRARTPGRRDHRTALPQRLRATDAARHTVRGGRQHLSQRARTRRIAPGVRGRRPAQGLRPCRGRRSRQRSRAHRTNGSVRPDQCRERYSAHDPRNGERARGRRR